MNADDLAALRQWFPQAEIWIGEHTGRWWAMARGRMLEGRDAADLGRKLTELLTPQGGHRSP